MKFAKGRTQPEPTSRHMATSGVASAALQQSPLLRQQATQLMSIRHGAQPSLLRKQPDGGVSQQVSLDEEEPLQGKFALVQQAALEEEEPLQGKFALVQQAALEEEEPLQGKFATVQQAALEEEEPLQGKFALVQRAGLEEEEPLQGKFTPAAVSQRQADSSNNTGMPDQLKSGIEGLSGYAMDDVKVHYNSAKPAAMQAHAYAQGTDIHIAPGQERHLPHEAWHVVQQKQGRVQATTQLKGEAINDDPGLEHEADVMGAKALQRKVLQAKVIQRERFDAGSGSVWHIHHDHIKLGNNQDSRVNFNGRSKKDIRQELGEKIDRYGLNVGGDLAASFRDCINYINNHF